MRFKTTPTRSLRATIVDRIKSSTKKTKQPHSTDILYIYGMEVKKLTTREPKELALEFLKAKQVLNYKSLGVDNGMKSCDVIIQKNNEVMISNDHKSSDMDIDLNFFKEVFEFIKEFENTKKA